MSTHSPAPWTISDPRIWVTTIVAADGTHVCRILGDNAEGNLPLLAAAPELLAAAKAALNDRMFKEWPGIATLLIDAIAKAEGR